MPEERGISSLAIDLTRMHRRTVTSFYSNLVTRPTGRAVRMGVESQLQELEAGPAITLSILDFSQVHILDYSCADEIVAKLLLRFAGEDRPTEVYFVARGLQDHHQEAIEAVLERHGLLLVVEEEGCAPVLLGPSNPLERACWAALATARRATLDEVGGQVGVSGSAAEAALSSLVSHRVVVPLTGQRYCALSQLLCV